jgi:hypothetical protein
VIRYEFIGWYYNENKCFPVIKRTELESIIKIRYCINNNIILVLVNLIYDDGWMEFKALP